jgi:hypothetical protein
MWCSAVQYSQYNTMQYSAVQSIQYNAIQYKTAEHIVQHRTIHYSAVMQNAAHHTVLTDNKVGSVAQYYGVQNQCRTAQLCCSVLSALK